MRVANRGGQIGQDAMSAAATDRLIASSYLTRAEDLLAKQSKRSVEDNRPHIARTLRISSATVRNIRRARRQTVPGWLKEKIIGLFVDAAQAELRAIQNEIDIARQIGLGNHDSKLVAARARAAALVEILDDVALEGTGDPQ